MIKYTHEYTDIGMRGCGLVLTIHYWFDFSDIA